MTQRKVITVDGLAASGKSTISALLAERLSYVHVNTGGLYRAIAYLAVTQKTPLVEAPLSRLLASHAITMQKIGDSAPEIFIDNVLIDSALLSTPEISHATSVASQYGAVRKYLLETQRAVFPNNNIVAEGRDMGTVVFPDSLLKFFVTASVEIRVARRIAQFGSASGDLEGYKKKIKIEILERDERDTKRALSPAVPAADAVIIDNSGPQLTKIVQDMYDVTLQRNLG